MIKGGQLSLIIVAILVHMAAGKKMAGAKKGSEAADDEAIKKMSLDEKIEAFRKFMLEQKDQHSRGVFLKRYFTQAEMSALWSRLKTMRAQSHKPEVAQQKKTHKKIDKKKKQ